MTGLRNNTEELLKNAFTLYSGKYYRSFTPGLIELINASRNSETYKDPAKYLRLQLELMVCIEKMDKTVSDGKKAAKAKNDDPELLEQRKRNRTLALAYRSIADGIAWRSFGFSRWTIRVLSQAKSPGYSHNKDGRNEEVRYATSAASDKQFILMHDTTNILRVGDLSLLGKKLPDSKPFLGEVKKGKNVITAKTVSEKIKGKLDVNKQDFRLYQAQVMVDSRRWFLKKKSIAITGTHPINKDFLVSAGAVMKQALKKGIHTRYLSPYLYIEAYDIPKILDDFTDAKGFLDLLNSLPSPEGELIGLQTNFDSLAILQVDEVIRSSPPYTVYPFTSEVIAKLITGQLLIRVLVIKSELEKAFANKGYELRLDEEVLDKSIANNMNDDEFLSNHILFPGDEPGEEYVYIVHIESRFMFPVIIQLAMITQEFVSVEYIVSLAEAARATAVRGEPNLFYQDIIDNKRWL